MGDEEQEGSNLTVIALLTEHLGYPPLSLIDDVINVVNQLLYKCSSAMQQYLLRRKDAGDPYTEEEIIQGIATLDTLLETQVDYNFDKFELYTLRNILMLPADLVEEGWIKLKHQENIEFKRDCSEDKLRLDQELQDLRKKIKYELIIRNLIKNQIDKGKKIIMILKLYQNFLINFNVDKLKDSDFSNVPKLSQDCIKNLKSIGPLDENLYFILKQVSELKSNAIKILKKMNNSNPKLKNIEFNIDIRSSYLDSRTVSILKNVGILDHETKTMETSNTLPYNPTLEDVDNVKQINNSLQDLE